MGERRKETFELMAKFNHSRRAKVAVARNSAAAAQITNVSATTTAAGGGSEQRGRPGVVFAAPLLVQFITASHFLPLDDSRLALSLSPG
jgi:hypothetical protein